MANSSIKQANITKLNNIIDDNILGTTVIYKTDTGVNVNGYMIRRNKNGLYRSKGHYFNMLSSAVGYVLSKDSYLSGNIRNYDRLVGKYDEDLSWHKRRLKNKKLTTDQRIYIENRISEDYYKLSACKLHLRQTLKSIKVA